MLATDVGQELQGIAVAGVHPGEYQVDVVPLHLADRYPIVAGFFDDMAQRLQHRSQQGQSRGIRIEDQDSKLIHRFNLASGARAEAPGLSFLRECNHFGFS